MKLINDKKEFEEFYPYDKKYIRVTYEGGTPIYTIQFFEYEYK